MYGYTRVLTINSVVAKVCAERARLRRFSLGTPSLLTGKVVDELFSSPFVSLGFRNRDNCVRLVGTFSVHTLTRYRRTERRKQR